MLRRILSVLAAVAIGAPALAQTTLLNVSYELEREDKAGIIDAEIPSDLYRRLNLKEGETLLVRPKKMQVFLDPADWISP